MRFAPAEFDPGAGVSHLKISSCCMEFSLKNTIFRYSVFLVLPVASPASLAVGLVACSVVSQIEKFDQPEIALPTTAWISVSGQNHPV